MRRRHHLDANHRAICDALVARGASVLSLAGNGKGIPDALIGWRGANYLMEFKRADHEKKQSKWKKSTREAQSLWKLKWTGQYCIVTSAEEAIAILEQFK